LSRQQPLSIFVDEPEEFCFGHFELSQCPDNVTCEQFFVREASESASGELTSEFFVLNLAIS
jgi:hypothetical protein